MCKVVHKINPNIVDWSKVDMNANNVFKKGINCNYAIECCSKVGCKIIGVGGANIRDGDKKETLAVVWQLMRLHYLQIIGSKTEEELLKWVSDSTG